MSFRTVFLLCLGALGACDMPGTEPAEFSTGIVDGVPHTVAPTALADLGRLSVHTLLPETSGLWEDIVDIDWISDSTLLIADRRARRLSVTTIEGRVLTTVGRRGEGPGEFEWISSVAILPGDTIAVYDRRLSRITRLGIDLRLLETLSLETVGTLPPLGLVWSGSVAVGLITAPEIPKSAGIQYNPAYLVSYDRSGRQSALRGPLALGHESLIFDGGRGSFPLPFARTLLIAGTNQDVLVSLGDSVRLRGYDSLLAPRRVITFPGLLRRITREDVDAVRQFLALATLPGDVESNILKPEYTPEVWPSFGRIVPDPVSGDIWLGLAEAFRRPPRVWVRAEPNGRLLSALEVPEGFDVRAVRGDRLAGIQRDALDVQTVAILEVTDSPQ